MWYGCLLGEPLFTIPPQGTMPNRWIRWCRWILKLISDGENWKPESSVVVVVIGDIQYPPGWHLNEEFSHEIQYPKAIMPFCKDIINKFNGFLFASQDDSEGFFSHNQFSHNLIMALDARHRGQPWGPPFGAQAGGGPLMAMGWG